MRRIVMAVTATAALAVPAVAQAAAPTASHVRQYRQLWREVRTRHGRAAAGCNLLGHVGACHHHASDSQVVRSIGVLSRILSPPVIVPAGPAYHPAPAYHATPTASYRPAMSPSSSPASSSGYAIPSSIVQCESGGNYSAVNASSGAGGAYQIMPSTWRAYGGQGSPQNASRAEQDRIAARVWAGQGRSAWSC